MEAAADFGNIIKLAVCKLLHRGRQWEEKTNCSVMAEEHEFPYSHNLILEVIFFHF